MFENLKDLLGEAYHDDITAEEVNAFFSGKNFADLSTGQYVDKNKYDRDIQNLNTTIAEKQNALNSKLTDDEKAQQEREHDKNEIQRLTNLLKQNAVNGNKDYAMSSTNELKTILGLPAAASFKHVSPTSAAVGTVLSDKESIENYITEAENE